MQPRSLSVFAATVLSALSLAAGAARADEVQFKNGDRLTGTIVSAEGGKLKIKTKVAGTVEVDLADVKTLSTDGPVKLKLVDGTVIQQPVAAGKEGQVAVQPLGAAGGAASQPVAITSIKTINQNETWTGSFTAGGLVTRGSSDTDAVNVSFDLLRRTDNDRIIVNGQYLFGRQRNADTGEKTTSTDNWRLGAEYNYFFTKHWYGFASFGVERDRIADLDLRLTPAVGVGYQWAESKKHNFSTEAGLAWLYESYSNDGTNDSIALKLAYHYDRQLNDGVKLFHNFTIYPSLEDISDYLILTDLGVRAALTDKMFTEFKVELRYDSTPAPGASRSDLRYILGVGWSF
jgi:putative salt-induced outer membrane protein YdiY